MQLNIAKTKYLQHNILSAYLLVQTAKRATVTGAIVKAYSDYNPLSEVTL